MTKKQQAQETSDREFTLIEGDSGAGKSFFVSTIPNAFIFDTDLGGGLRYADPWIAKIGSRRLEAATWSEVHDTIREEILAGTLPLNVAIDHVTILHQNSVLDYNPTGEADFGRAAARATADWRKVRELVRRADCNLYAVSHTTPKYDQGEQVGTKADGAKNIEADFSVVLRLVHEEGGVHPSKAKVIKWRRHPEDPRGAPPKLFTFTIEEYAGIVGAGFGRERKPVDIATAEQVAEIERLLSVVRTPEGWTEKALKKAGAETWAEITKEQAEKMTAHLKGIFEKGEK